MTLKKWVRSHNTLKQVCVTLQRPQVASLHKKLIVTAAEGYPTMTQIAHFEDSINAASRLIAMYKELRGARKLGQRGRLTPENQDLLWLPRSTVVVSLSALDAYIHSVLYKRIPEILREGNAPNELCDKIAEVVPIKNGNSFRDTLDIFKDSDSISRICEKLRDQSLSFSTFQAPDKIVQGYSLIGHPNIFDDVSAIWQGPRGSSANIRRRLYAYYKRRNQIAHEGDRDQNGQARAMTPDYADKCYQFIGSLARRLDRVVYQP